MPRPAPKAPPPQPIQYSQLTPEDFSDPARVNKLNGMLTQLINAVNAGSGATGRTILPAGIDVQGETISGLGAPKSPSDAVSAAHAESNYGAPALAPQLDIGGANALKGLTGLWSKVLALQKQIVSAGVRSLNGLTGALNLVPGSGNVTINPSGSDIAISVSATGGGINELTGDVTAGPGSGSQAAQVVATHLAAPLPVAQGGSGTATPSLVGGANVTISGAWPNQTVDASGTGMANPMTTVGDLIVGGTVSGGVAAPTRLAAGTSGYVLTSGGPGVAPSYQPGGGGGGGFTPYTIAPSPPPLSSTLTWVNQGVATASDVNGLTVQTPGTTSTNINSLVKSLPATPYTFTIGIFLAAPAASVGLGGIAVLDGSGKIVFYGIAAQTTVGYELAFQKYTTTAFVGTYATASLGSAGVPFIFLRLADDGTNFVASYSYDGVHFNQVGAPQSRTGYLSPSQIGLCVDDSANVPLSMTVAYWAGI